MKKTLLAVAIPALLASGAASATTIYDQNGTKIDIKGQLRIVLEYKDNRDGEGEDGTKFRDAGSRFGFKVTHDLGDGLYGVGEFEWGNNTQQREDNFNLKNRLGYVGLGLQDVGEVTIGHVLSPFDDVAMTDYTYDYGGILDFGHTIKNPKRLGGNNGDNFIARVSNTAKFMSADYNGFSFGGTYTAQSDDGDSSWKNIDRIRNAYTLAAFYDSGFGLKVNAGYGFAKLQGGTAAAVAPALGTLYVGKNEAEIYGMSVEYSIDALSVAVDLGQARLKKDTTTTVGATQTSSSTKQKADLYGLGFKYNLGKSNIYGNAYYADGNSEADAKYERTGILGVDYRFTPAVRTFVEYANVRTKLQDDSKEKENKAMVGMRVYF